MFDKEIFEWNILASVRMSIPCILLNKPKRISWFIYHILGQAYQTGHRELIAYFLVKLFHAKKDIGSLRVISTTTYENRDTILTETVMYANEMELIHTTKIFTTHLCSRISCVSELAIYCIFVSLLHNCNLR